ncbi:MAG: recombinational DNA repair ATPase RecF [Saprospiraceae bacterium]|jgi:recombinational DNA repair ATPase RecF
MEENFITHIRVNVSDLDIPLSKDKRRHLIITGKNGSGKTGLLLELDKFLNQIEKGRFAGLEGLNESIANITEWKIWLKNSISNERRKSYTTYVKNAERQIAEYGGTEIIFSQNDSIKIHDKYHSGQYLMAFFDAKRTINLNVPKGISKVNLKEKRKV